MRHLLVLSLILGSATPVLAQIKPTSPVLVLDLFDPRNRFVVVSAASFDDALRDPAARAVAARSREDAAADVAASDSPLDRIVSACSGAAPGLALDLSVAANRDNPVAKLQGCMDCLSAFQEKRYVTSRNDDVMLIVLFNGAVVSRAQIRPLFEETPRKSELFATGKALFEILRREATAMLSCATFTYTLQHERSRFRVRVPLPPGAASPVASAAERAAAAPAPAPAAAAPAPAPAPAAGAAGGLTAADLKQPAPGAQPAAPAVAAAAAEPAAARSPEVVLGPIEKWFFSADFSIDKASAGIGKTPTPDKDTLKSKDFFVALNFALGDLLADRDSPLQGRNFLKELLLKVQVTPSKEPWEAWAVGIGLRGYRLKTILWNLDVAHPYVSVGRQKVEGEEPRWRAVFGIGFDPRSINQQE